MGLGQSSSVRYATQGNHWRGKGLPFLWWDEQKVSSAQDLQRNRFLRGCRLEIQ